MPTCCLCGNVCDCRYGHNPEPIIGMKDKTNHKLRCCSFCNVSKVIPARMAFVKSISKNWLETTADIEEKKFQYIESFLKDYMRGY